MEAGAGMSRAMAMLFLFVLRSMFTAKRIKVSSRNTATSMGKAGVLSLGHEADLAVTDVVALRRHALMAAQSESLP